MAHGPGVPTVWRVRTALTVATTRGQVTDLVLETPSAVTGDVVAEAIRAALDLPGGDELHVRDSPLDATMRLGSPPLLQGASVVARRPGTLVRHGEGHPPSPLVLAVTSGACAGEEVALRPGTCTIGRSSAADLTLDDPSLSRLHADVCLDAGGARIRDRDTTNGTDVDGERIDAGGWTALRAGSTIALGSHRLEVRSGRPRGCTTRPDHEGHLAVITSPSVSPQPPAVTVSFPDRPTPPGRRRLPWLMALLPLPVAALMAVLVGPRMMVFALMTPLLVLGNHLSDRMAGKADGARALSAWRAEMRRSRDRLEQAMAQERRRLRRAHPDAHEVRHIATVPSSRLWERRRENDAGLTVRAGTGPVPSEVIVRAGAERQAAPKMAETPVVVDLDTATIVGITGDQRAVAGWVRWCVGQLITLHPPSELQVAVLGASDLCGALAWAPHVTSRSPQDLAAVIEDRGGGATARPTTLLVVDDPAALREDPTWRRALASPEDLGLRIIVTSQRERDLPHECRCVIRLGVGEGTLRDRDRELPFVPDGVSTRWAATVGRALAPLRDATPLDHGSELPATVALSHLVDVSASSAEVVRAWDGPATWRVPIGTSTDGPMHVDLLRDGPHALIAGTTGSGKSELLQTWIASLALHLGPRDLNLVLVDYKGGSAFAGCADLPHTVGMLTDLDPAGAERALSSLDAELRRRERVLAEHGASDIDALVGAGHALPRLVIVVDEFRMLAEEQPEVLRDLVRLAALGRSLGIHLVLATQRPAGVVTPEIRANVNLRIALRVRDRSDSEDVIASADAAAIPEGVPGRAYLRTGDSPARAFQCAYAGAAPGRAAGLTVRDAAGTVLWRAGASGATDERGDGTRTEVDAVVASTRAGFELSGQPLPHRPWLPPLPLLVEEAHVDNPEQGAPWGLTDHPDEQRRGELLWTPDDGTWAVIGAPGSGRTTALASLLTRAYRHLQGELVAHLVTASTSQARHLADHPGVASLLDIHDSSAVQQLAHRARLDGDERRAALHQSGFSSHPEWRSAWARGEAPQPPPVLLVLVDGWAHLSTSSGPEEAETVAALTALARDGAELGICLALAGGRELLSGQVASTVSRRLVLDLQDRSDALSLGLRSDAACASRPPGRCYVLPGGHLAQLAMPVAAPGGTAPATDCWRWGVESLPALVRLEELPSQPAGTAGEGFVLGHSGERGRAATVQLSPAGGGWTVVGPPRSGRSSALMLASTALARAERPVILVETAPDAALQATATHCVDPEDLDRLVELIRGHDDPVVVIDDVERVEGTPCEAAVRELARPGAARGAVLLTATSTAAATSVRGVSATLCRSRHGLLLQPSSRADGDCFGVRVPPLHRVPGRGYLIQGGTAERVQVALAQ